VNLCHDFLVHILLRLNEILSPMDLLFLTPGPSLLDGVKIQTPFALVVIAELHIKGLLLWAGVPPLIN
jgi:hypothetical protein